MIINQWELKLETGNLLKAREMRVTKSWLVLISHLIANCFCLKQKLAIKSMAPIGKEAMNSLVWFFCCKETRQTFRTTWRCFSLRFNAMIFDFFIDIFQCRGEIVIFIEPLFLADSSILEQRPTMTENKLWECSDYQLTLLEQFPTEYRSAARLLLFSHTSLCDWSRKLVSQLAIKCKIKTNHDLVTRISRALRRLPVSSLSSHWLIIMASFCSD